MIAELSSSLPARRVLLELVGCAMDCPPSQTASISGLLAKIILASSLTVDLPSQEKMGGTGPTCAASQPPPSPQQLYAILP